MNTAQIRQKLNIAFDDAELSAFSLDYFPSVYDKFSQGMRKDDKIRLLLDYCRRHPTGFEVLLKNVRLEYTSSVGWYNSSKEHLKPLIMALEAYLTSLHSTSEQEVSNADSSFSGPKDKSASSTAKPDPEKPALNFKLQIANLSDINFEIRVDSSMGQPKGNGSLPYDAKGLIAVLKALGKQTYKPEEFSETQNDFLNQLGLIHNSRFVANKHRKIGKGLYQALFSDQVNAAFEGTLMQARIQRGSVNLQLRLDPDTVSLARYPWELLHNEHRPLLANGAVELTRYITYSEAPTSLKIEAPGRLLYITARPIDPNLALLPLDERQMVLQSLQPLTSDGRLTIDELSPPTYEALFDALQANPYHIIHFDGHGIFGKKCPTCASMNLSHLFQCANPHCQDSLTDVQPSGFLAFEDDERNVDYVAAPDLEHILFGSEIRLAMIFACVSATVRGESIWSGIGPSLIRAGIPAVAAMQLPIKTSSAVKFAKGFYTSLTQGNTIPRAMAQGRRRLSRNQAYFIPTLYLRSSDEKGELFTV